ncbi:MAG: hypothetical protein AAB706_03400 [Patescibacteria group bacterium]
MIGPCDCGITPQDRLTAAGERALDTARSLWQSVITDPHHGAPRPAAEYSLARIDEMIRGEQGLDWSWRGPYRGDGDYQWCGAFAAWCWGAAGLEHAHRLAWWSSTYRLDRWASYQPLEIGPGDPRNPAPATGEPRRLYQRCDGHSSPATLLWVPRAGDVAVVGTRGYGTHITIVEGWDAGNRLVVTLSGNGWGDLPGGRRGQGVVRRAYPIGTARPDQTSHVRRMLRPAITDLRS